MRPRDAFLQLFAGRPPIIGMVHLAALPGAPRYGGNLDAVLERALADTEALIAGGVDGLMVAGHAPPCPRRGPCVPW